MNNRDHGFACGACEAIGAPDVMPRLKKAIEDATREKIAQELEAESLRRYRAGEPMNAMGLAAAFVRLGGQG